MSSVAYFFTSPPAKPVTPLGLRAPELILTGTFNQTLDIWSWGCLVFELVTGEPLFCITHGEFEDDDHLLCLTERLGPLPDVLFLKWKSSSLYFTPDGRRFNSQLGGVAEGEEPLVLDEETMEEAFDRTRPELDGDEAAKVKALIRRVLQYDPEKRPSPADLLRDPWFEESDDEGGLSK